MLPGEKYHVFNRANGRENLFAEEKNYFFFLNKVNQYILPVCRLFGFCLLPRHFHLVIEVNPADTLITHFHETASAYDPTQKELELKISRSFGNLFSSYSQAFNKVYDRRGSLFIPSMKTELIKDDHDLRDMIHHTHANPVHHGFVSRMEDWQHSSYKSYLNNSNTRLDRSTVLEKFGGVAGFKRYHEQPIDLNYKFIDG